MIKLTFKFNGAMVNKPVVKEIDIPDDQVAMTKINDKTGKVEELTVYALYKAYKGHMQRITDSVEIEDQIDYTYFTTWLESKYRNLVTNHNLIDYNISYIKS